MNSFLTLAWLRTNLRWVLLWVLPAASAATLSLQSDAFLLDGKPFDMWGIRTASASQSEALTERLIAQLDEYKKHNVNTVSVYFMGSAAAYSDPFSPDGTAIDREHLERMVRIVKECDRRGMVAIVGVLYQRANPPRLCDWESVRRAIKTVTESLRPYRNLVINIANEQNSENYKKLPWSRVMNSEDMLELCRVVHSADPRRLAGAGGYDPVRNEAIGRSRDVDVLLSDTIGPQSSGELYRRYLAAGVKGKPMVNVETFGAWTNRFRPQGVFPDEVRKEYLREVDEAPQSWAVPPFSQLAVVSATGGSRDPV